MNGLTFNLTKIHYNCFQKKGCNNNNAEIVSNILNMKSLKGNCIIVWIHFGMASFLKNAVIFFGGEMRKNKKQNVNWYLYKSFAVDIKKSRTWTFIRRDLIFLFVHDHHHLLLLLRLCNLMKKLESRLYVCENIDPNFSVILLFTIQLCD